MEDVATVRALPGRGPHGGAHPARARRQDVRQVRVAQSRTGTGAHCYQVTTAK